MKKIHVNEDYDPKTLTGDIAIIQLNSAVKLRGKVIPICLPRSYNHDSLVTVTGMVGEVILYFVSNIFSPGNF